MEHICLISEPLHHGRYMDRLLLTWKGSEPIVVFDVVDEGGSPSCAGGDIVIRKELRQNLMPETLTAFLKREDPFLFNDLIDFSVYEKDARVIRWCEEVRRLSSQQK